jgi:hypothetical protein
MAGTMVLEHHHPQMDSITKSENKGKEEWGLKDHKR